MIRRTYDYHGYTMVYYEYVPAFKVFGFKI